MGETILAISDERFDFLWCLNKVTKHNIFRHTIAQTLKPGTILALIWRPPIHPTFVSYVTPDRQEPTYVNTVVKAKYDSEEEVTVKIPVLLPHRILAYLVDELGLKISDAALAKYWSHCKTFCSWARHPDLDGSHIPLTLYGDTARYGTGFDQSKVTGCFLSMVLWRPKSTRTSQWLLWSLDNELSLGWKSHNPLYFAIVQSLNAVFDGLTPEGTKLSNKYVVTQIKGDWEYHYHTWRLCRWWKTRWICWRCDAENHPRARHSMCDLSDNPSWAQTQHSHNYFVVHGMKENHVCAFACTYLAYTVPTLLLVTQLRTVSLSNSNYAGGPFLGLRCFDFTMLCHCSLHNVNLGVAQDATGSTLLFGCIL